MQRALDFQSAPFRFVQIDIVERRRAHTMEEHQGKTTERIGRFVHGYLLQW